MKKHNFNAGPSILPREVIEKTAQAVLDFNGSGLSIMEISHRAKDFQPVVDEAVALFKEQLNHFKTLNTDNKRLLYYLFTLSNDKNISYLWDILFWEFGLKIDLNEFEQIILWRIWKKDYLEEFFYDPNLECEDIVKFFNFSDKSLPTNVDTKYYAGQYRELFTGKIFNINSEKTSITLKPWEYLVLVKN